MLTLKELKPSLLAMAGPKILDDATPDLCVNCGMPPCKVEETIPVTLLLSKATRQVLCLEAGKDFVDTLMGFLTLPVGCVIKLLEEATMIRRPECKIAPRPSTPLTFPPGIPYTPSSRKGKNDSGEHFALSSISNILASVVKLDDKEMSADKNCLVDPKPVIPFGAGKLLDLHNTPCSSSTYSTEGVNFYGCGNACSFYATTGTTKCPKHKKKMNVPLKFVERSDAHERSDENSQDQPDFTESVRIKEQRGRHYASDNCSTKFQRRPSRAPSRSIRVNSLIPACDSEFVRRVTRGLDMQLALPTSPASPLNPKGKGYVKDGTKYMITNTLEIYASSEAIKALIALNIIRSERVGDLDTMPLSVVTAEVLQLLKLSFTSTNVLNDVFGKYCADVKSAGFQEKKDAFFPQCADKPCCQCSRMGTPMTSPAQSCS